MDNKKKLNNNLKKFDIKNNMDAFVIGFILGTITIGLAYLLFKIIIIIK